MLRVSAMPAAYMEVPMRFCLAVLVLCGVAQAQDLPSVCVGGCPVPAARKVVVHQTVVVTAQEHADHLAATGTFAHCSRRGRGYEGIGFSPASPDDACRRCCYWGQRRVREIGTAWCPCRRGWVAVVRYE